MRLSERLMTIAGFVKKGAKIADIGTDHGYLPVYLMENKITDLAIASDISPGSLDKIIGYVRDHKLEDRIETRLGDGLDVLRPFEVDTVIMAGMGGLLISEILEANKEVTENIDNFIFQPMVASKELRAYLLENNYKIIDEKLAREANKYYEIILAKRGWAQVENPLDLDINPKLIENQDPLLEEFINHKIKKLKGIHRGLESKNTPKALERKEELLSKIKSYKEVLDKIEG